VKTAADLFRIVRGANSPNERTACSYRSGMCRIGELLLAGRIALPQVIECLQQRLIPHRAIGITISSCLHGTRDMILGLVRNRGQRDSPNSRAASSMLCF
jgi:hypothetical protein